MKNKIFFLTIGILLSMTISQAQIRKSINVSSPGSLFALVVNDKNTITDLTIIGTVNDADFATIKQMPALKRLDMGGALIENETLPSQAFYNKSYDEVILPSNLRILGTQSFRLSNLKAKLVLPSTIEEIGSNAFMDAKLPGGIALPSSLRIVKEGSFQGVRVPSLDFSVCPNLENIYYYSFARTQIGDDIIDLSNNSKLTDFKANPSLAEGPFTFYGGHVVLPNHIVELPAYLFAKFEGTVQLPSKLRSLGTQSFRLSNLKAKLVLPSTIEEIGSNAFMDAKLPGGIALPSSLRIMKEGSFQGVRVPSLDFSVCPNLENIYYYSFARTQIGDDIIDLSNNSKLTDFKANPSLAEGPFTFYGGHVVLPNHIIELPAYLFAKFEGTVQLPSKLRSLGTQSFRLSNLKAKLVLPSTIEEIGSNAFMDAKLPGGIALPSSLRIMKEGSFQGVRVPSLDFSVCPNLENIYYYSFARTQIGDDIIDLSNNSKLTDFKANPSLAEGPFTFYGGHVVLPNHIIELPAYLFAKFEGTTMLPNNLRSIKSRAFINAKISEVDLPSSLTNIEANAFINSTSLEQLIIRSLEPPTLGNAVFNGVNKDLCKLIVPQTSIHLYRTADQWKDFTNIDNQGPSTSRIIHVSFPGNLKAQLGDDSDSVIDLTLTGRINDADFATIKQMSALKRLNMGEAVAEDKRIPSYTFQNKTLDKLILPLEVEMILQGAFQSFQGNIVLQEGLKVIDYQSFLLVNLSEELVIPNSLEVIGDFAFGGANILKGMKFGRGLKRLGRCSFDQMNLPFMDFSNCENLEEIGAATFRGVSLTANNTLDLSQSSKISRAIHYGGSINDDYAGFSHFTGHVVLSDELEAIPTYLFYKFRGSVTLPKSLKTIKDKSFTFSGIKEIDLPSGLLSIEKEAFLNCTDLEKITSRSILPATLGINVFSGINKNTCQLIVADESVRLYKNSDQWKDFLNIQGNKDLNSEEPLNLEEYKKGKEGTVHIWINRNGPNADSGGRAFIAYDFDKQSPMSDGNGFQGTYKTIEIGEYEFMSENLQAKYFALDGIHTYGLLEWTDESIAAITKKYSDEKPLSIEEFRKLYGSWFNFYHNTSSYGFGNLVKFRNREGGHELSGWGLPEWEDMAQLVGLAPRNSGNVISDVLSFLGASKADVPKGHEGTWFNKNKNISGLTLTPLGSNEPLPGPPDLYSYDFKELSRLRLRGRGEVFNLTEKHDFGHHHQLFQFMQVRYNRAKTDEELGYKFYIDSCNNRVVMLPYDQRTRLTELPKGLERGIALRYANKSEMKIYKSWTAICYEADWIREQVGTYTIPGDNTRYPKLPPRPQLKYTCVDLNNPEDFEKGKEGSVHIWISRTGPSKDTEGLGFEDYDFDKNVQLSHHAGMQGTYKTIEIGEYEYTSQNLRAKHHALPETDYTWLDFAPANVAAITKTYSQEQPLSIDEFNKFYGSWFTLLDGVQSFRVPDLVKFRDGEKGQELYGWGLPELNDIAQLIGQAPRKSNNLRSDILSFIGASNTDAPVGHEAIWFNSNSNSSGLTITPLGSHHPLGNTGYLVGERPDDTYYSFKHLSRLALKGKGQIFTFADNQDIGYNGFSAHYTQVRYNRAKTDQELGYKIFVDLEKDSVIIAPLSQQCNDNLRELSRGLERGVVLRHANFEANKVFRSWSQIKAEATEIKYTVRNLPNTDALLPCVPVTSVTLNKTRINLVVEETETLVATVLPQNATNKTVIWHASDSSIVRVTDNGLVTAIKKGEARITVETVDGGKSATCNIVVIENGDDNENPDEPNDVVTPNIPNIPKLQDDEIYTDVSEDDYKVLFAYNKSGDRTERNVIVLETRVSNQEGVNYVFTDQISERQVHIYPNPTKGQLIVELSDMSSGNISIVNLQGQVVSSHTISGDKMNLDISSQPSGIYIMYIVINGQKSSLKIIKE